MHSFLGLIVDEDEIILLRKTWQDMADRTDGKGIDRETFLQYFPLEGLLGGNQNHTFMFFFYFNILLD